MAPQDFRPLPMTKLGQDSMLVALAPYFWGVFKACLLLSFGLRSRFNFVFAGWFWVIVFQQSYLESVSDPDCRLEATQQRWYDLRMQFRAFCITMLVIGPGWPWAVVGFKIFAALIAASVVLHLPLVVLEFMEIEIPQLYASVIYTYWERYQSTFNFVLRFTSDVFEYLEAVRWYFIPWGFRLVGQWIEEKCWTTRKPYEYEDIDSAAGEIRLLRLRRQWLFWGHLHGSIEVVRVDAAPEYEAMSYRWTFGSKGPEVRMRTIFVDNGDPPIRGRSLMIPSSAWEMLHAMSSLQVERLVWIDAICINQKNKKEKSSQIPLMGQIYSKAARVVVWPGDRFDSGMASALVLRLFIANYMFEARDEEFRSLFEDEIERTAWKAMVRLFGDPYFTRIWCVQEVALGEVTDILLGNRRISWEVFAETLATWLHPKRRSSIMSDNNENAFDLAPRSTEAPSGALIMNILRCQKQNPEKGKDMDIGQLLSLCARFHATEPKDRVFGLGGLLSTPLPTSLLDDSKLDSDIFLVASIQAVKQSKDPFATLVYAGIGWDSGTPELSSWVVNWAHPRQFFSLYSPNLAHFQNKGQSTAIHLQAEIDVDNTGDPLLLVKGFILDTIEEHTMAVTQPTEQERPKSTRERLILRSQWYQDAAELANPCRDEYLPTKQTREEALWRTIIMDRTESERPAPQYLAESHTIYRELCKARLASPAADTKTWLESIKSTRALNDVWPQTLKDRGQLHEFMAGVGSAGDGRRFSVTKGGLMCLTPPLSKVGDIVAIFHGAPIPFLLRRQSVAGRSGMILYRLVGECYVHGFMDRFDVVEGFKAPPSTMLSIF
jgi:hypothetical protein